MSPNKQTSANRSRMRIRVAMISAAIGGLIVLVVSVLFSWGDNHALEPPAIFETEAGTCLNWTKADTRDMHVVPCARPYLFQVTGATDLGREYGEKAPYPSATEWQRIKTEFCTPVAQRFLRTGLDPHGRFSVNAFTPSAEGWRSGERNLHCGLQQPGPSGKLFRISGGSTRQLDQSNIYDVGRCLGINGTAVWDPVDCAQPHSLEITGVVDLSEQFPDQYPPARDQDGFLATRCGELTAQYAGGPTVATDKHLTPYWDTLTQESWDAGSRQVNCKVSAELPDGSGLAPVTGSVKGPVQIGQQPAPEIRGPSEAGVPAQQTR